MNIWKIFSTYFKKGNSKIVTEPVKENRGASWGSSFGVTPSFPPKEALDPYGEHAYLYAAIRRSCEDLAALPLKLIKGKGENATEIFDHPVLDLLNQPSSNVDGYLFRQSLVMDLILNGNFYFLLLGKGEKPVSIVRLHPSETEFVTSSEKGIFAIKNSSFGKVVQYPLNKVFFGRSPSYAKGPKSLYGTGCTEPLFQELKSDTNAMMLCSESSAKGRPDILISPSDEADVWPKQTRDQIVSEYKKMAKSGGVIALSGMAKIDMLNLSPKDMEYKEARQFARESISAAIGVPGTVLGLKDANYATSLNQRKSYWQSQTHRARKFDIIFTKLAKLWDPELVIKHSFDEIESLSSKDKQLERIQMHISNGISPKNAYLYEGLGDISFEDIEAQPKEEEEKDKILIDFFTKSENERSQNWENWIVTRQAPAEKKFLKSAKQYLKKQKKSILSNFDELKKKSIISIHGRDIEYIQKDISLTTEILSEQEQNKIIGETLFEVFEKTFSEVQEKEAISIFKKARKELNIQVPINQELVDSYLSNMNRQLQNTTLPKIKNMINEGIREGLTVEEIRNKINTSNLFNEDRALKIARTEATKCVNAAQVNAMKFGIENDIPVFKEWLTERDSKVREAHSLLDGMRIAPDDQFTIPPGSEYSSLQTLSPGDFGEAALDVNCRCTVISVVNPSSIIDE